MTAEQRREARQRQRDYQDALQDMRNLREATEWANEPVPRGIRREVRLVKFPDQPRRPGLSVQVQFVDLAESLFWFELERHPEIWPGAATMPVHDEPMSACGATIEAPLPASVGAEPEHTLRGPSASSGGQPR